MRVLLFFLPLFLFSSSVSYEFLQSKPKSRALDFFSLLFLENMPNTQEGVNVFYALQTPKPAHYKALLKITNDKYLKEFLRCQRLEAPALLTESLECSLLGFSFVKSAKLSSADLIVLGLRYKKINQDLAQTLFFMADSAKFLASNTKQSLKVFSKSSSKKLIFSLDKRLSNDFLNAVESSYYLDRSVERVAISPEIQSLSASILSLDPNVLSPKASFFYAMMAIKQGEIQKAVNALQNAQKDVQKRIDKDKIAFWLWLITKDKVYFNDLKNSTDINFYTINFREQNHLAPLKTYAVHARAIKNAKAISQKQASDPFYWNDLLEEIRNTKKQDLPKILQKLGSNLAEPFRVAVYNKMQDYNVSYFIHPWKKELKHLDKEYQALVLSLARQESAFVQSALSTSYAIGAMQMMPFLIKAIAKDKKEEVFLPDFFYAKKILPYAIYHINVLRKSFDKHPLFIAYAYNGGAGFTKRLVINKLFKGKKYEPFLSIELVPYAESREYAKRVLANYYMYRKILGIPVLMKEILKLPSFIVDN